MGKRTKSAREKLEAKQEAEVKEDPKGRRRVVIPRPLDVDELVRRRENRGGFDHHSVRLKG